MSVPVTAMDADLAPSEAQPELPLPTWRPFGHAVMRPQGSQFCLVSEARGLLGYFADVTLAQPFLRMLIRNAWRGRGRLDFRLFRWTPSGWEIAQRTMEDVR